MKRYVLVVLPIEMPFLIKEYICFTYAIIVWAGVAGLDHMRLEECRKFRIKETHYKK